MQAQGTLSSVQAPWRGGLAAERGLAVRKAQMLWDQRGEGTSVSSVGLEVAVRVG